DIVSSWTTPYAATDEMHDEAEWAQMKSEEKLSARGIEVGHIFHFGTKYSEAMGAKVMGPDGKEVAVSMGSYGIGPSRLVAGIIEASHDENGIIWPQSVAPFGAVIVNMKTGDADCDDWSKRAHDGLVRASVDPLLDDTDQRAGAKFATADLIGAPWQVVIGPRGVKNGVVEVKNRASGEKSELSLDDALAKIAGAYSS
ncbi:MAG: His/Gly/Thr/Pro-type tRNA ligase C-terminal domain-containing protein, partial [Pseudomonadota bacterium]